ncbi:GspH/FimT family pseudopilin [Cupriavidus campinensis]|uniref:Type II secretion system protein H n=1 Tax=Cupriavidus campinensis TaxID=151783 RepID=A0AAE9HZ57_9BURK|nr:GspH/FimT family pseudopilin [Cupriavidus campinensis]TSP12454.1 prepilin-type N-terminal cleavage/methylation domain-containing protein [Cupriavidus campinensis]URF03368.1 GspH/FimT family pseudopilin [Cupriavidus campinensis]
MRPNRHIAVRHRGFTLLELITTMAVGIVLVGFAVPSMTTFMRNHRVLTAADSLNIAVTKARSIAASTTSYVTVAPIEDGSWNSGWRVFSEHGTPNGEFDGADTLIAQYDRLPADVTITATTSPGNLGYIAFSPVGYSQTASKQQMSMSVGFQIGVAKRVVEVSLLGRSRVCDPTRDATTCVMP